METLIFHQPEPGIGLIELNRPEALNVLNTRLLSELSQLLKELSLTAGLRVVLLTGTGEKAFAAGADIAEMRGLNALEGAAFSERGMQVMRQLERLAVPVIALVNGYALGGGCELALACDFIFASDTARFGQPEVTLGVPPGFGGSQRLTRRVGTAQALELLLSGRPILADEALRIGLVNRVVKADVLLETGLQCARQIAANGAVAVAMTKALVHQGQHLDLAPACALESTRFGLAFSSDDRQEGMSAFLERRQPVFSGK